MDSTMSDDEIDSYQEMVAQLNDSQVNDGLQGTINHLLSIGLKSDIRGQVILEILKFFKKLDMKYIDQEEAYLQDRVMNKDLENLREVQAKILISVTYSTNIDMDFIKELIKTFNNYIDLPQLLLSPFNVAFLLCLTSKRNMDDKAISVLKTFVKRFCNEQKMKNEGSKWIRKQSLMNEFDIEQQMLPVVHISKIGQLLGLELMNLSFQLIDAIPSFAKSNRILEKSPKFLTTNEAICSYGVKLLFLTFESHPEIQESAILKLFGKIINKTVGSVTIYIEILSKLVTKCPQLLLNNKKSILELIDWIPFCPYPASIQLIKSLFPLIKLSMTLKNSFVECLKHRLYHRNIEVRKVAVAGFLMALKHFKIAGAMPLSQTQQRSSAIMASSQLLISQRFDFNANEALCLDLFRMLSKSIKNQGEVKETLCGGIFAVVKQNPKLIGVCSELLFRELQPFYEEDNTNSSPIRLRDCLVSDKMTKTFVIEPLAPLLMSVQLCLRVVKRDTFNLASSQKQFYERMALADSITKLEEVMNSLVNRMSEIDLNMFALDKLDYFKNEMAPQSKLLANQLLEILDVIIEYYYMNTEDKNENFRQIILKWLKMQEKLDGFLKDAFKKEPVKKEKKAKTKTKGAKKRLKVEEESDENDENTETLTDKDLTQVSTASSLALPTSSKSSARRYLYTIEFIELILTQCFNRMEIDQLDVKLLISKPALKLRFLNALNNKIITYGSYGRCDEFSTENPEKLKSFFKSMTKILFLQLFPVQSEPEEDLSSQSTSSSRDTQFIITPAEFLVNLLQAIKTRQPEELVNIVAHALDILEDDQILTTDQIMLKIVAKMKEIITFLTNDEKLYKAFAHFTHILEALMPFYTENNIVELFDLIEKIAKKIKSEDPFIVKNLLNCLFKLGLHVNKKCLTMAEILGKDICKSLNYIDESFTEDHEIVYNFINEKTATTVCSLVIYHGEQILSETDWIFKKLETQALHSGGNFMEKEKREELEKRICTRIGRLIAIINCLIVSKIPTVSCNCLYIFLKKAFDILTAVTKYYINLLNLKPKMNMPEPISLPEVFYNLVDICSDTVLKNLFTFLNYSEPPENRVDLDNKKSKRNENSNTKRLKLMKNRKLITNLIFSVENMERYSIDLNRKLPGDVQKTVFFYRAQQGRDFKILTGDG